MGVVYKAEDTKLERTVALKFLAQHLLNDEEAKARLRPLAILDSALRGEKGQPSSQQLSAVKKAVASGKPLEEIFKGVAAVQLAVEGNGPSIQLRLTKKEGIPIHLVPEGTEGASTCFRTRQCATPRYASKSIN